MKEANMKKALFFIIPALMVGCMAPDPYPVGSMLPGKIISLSDGNIFSMEIQLTALSAPSGKMTATDYKSNEKFNGTYTCIVETKIIQDSKPTFWGSQETKTSQEVSDVVPGVAVLVGDKGTVINIKMKIKAGNPPFGFGEGEDNKAKKYTIQF
ncbi:hypothetical protein [Geothrix sp.]|jgi:hypothetical protein|uniref:hypothetical protein n=1 Tax=Geothrix sp. TaxID=1962974 RepID=UPI0025BDA046|nr:hypothetical protein [Geothrix sp.]